MNAASREGRSTDAELPPSRPTIRISIVVPVYQGELPLADLLAEIEPLTVEHTTPGGNRAVICEVLLVHDCGPDRSDEVIERLAARYDWVRPVWLSRNYGQHAATLAGMAGALGDWVATLDEDRQHNPRDIDLMADLALAERLQLVYARPRNSAPHGWLRNAASHLAKTIANGLIGNTGTGHFSSFRLVAGDAARSLAAYCGSGVYLDVALGWIVARVGFCGVELRADLRRPSGYSLGRLLSHFSVLVMTAGARPLRFISLMGLVSIGLALLISLWAIYAKLSGQVSVEGWTSLVIVIVFFSGCILLALGVIAEYLALTMSIAMGKPLYVVTTTPTRHRERP
ncbi:MAG TPA: mannosyltransferase [Planctomycetaceae bacterium]|nr:mannosyltransferase [Planctomycetaceae bacterium]